MPLYEYQCDNCGNKFDELVSIKESQNPPCPCCGSDETKKLISVFGSFDSSGNSSNGCSSGGFT